MVDEYVAVDVETTGLSPERDRLLEIGAVLVQNGKVSKTWGTLIDTGQPVPPRIRELTGITDEMRKSGVPVREAVRGFLEFRGRLPLAGHNTWRPMSCCRSCGRSTGSRFRMLLCFRTCFIR